MKERQSDTPQRIEGDSTLDEVFEGWRAHRCCTGKHDLIPKAIVTSCSDPSIQARYQMIGRRGKG